MNKTKIIVLLLLFSSLCFANNVVNNTIKLADNYKKLGTFSGEVSENKSFHLIFTKNKDNKRFAIHPFLFDGVIIKEFEAIENDLECGIVSYHYKNKILTLLVSYKNRSKKFIQKININTQTQEISKEKEKSHNQFEAYFRENERSIIIYKKLKKLIFDVYDGSQNYSTSTYTFEKFNDKVKSFVKDFTIEAIKTNEFVKNGSTSSVKAYLKKNDVYFTKEYRPKSITKILKLNLKDSVLKPLFLNVKNLNNDINFKKNTTFLNGNKIYNLALNKHEGVITISDVNSEKVINEIVLDTTLNSKILANNTFEGFEKFLKNAARSKYIPTITVNETITDKVRIRVDYVDISYSYHHDWFWFHQQMFQQQMMMQQQMIRAPRGFGPTQPNNMVSESATIDKKNRFFELLIDENGKLSEEKLPETIYKEIDKNKYLEQLKKDEMIINESSCFLKNSFRFIGYHKTLKEFVIQTNAL